MNAIFMLLANETADWIAAIASSIAAIVAIVGLFVAHRLVVRHDTKKIATDLLRKIVENTVPLQDIVRELRRYDRLLSEAGYMRAKFTEQIEEKREIEEKAEQYRVFLFATARTIELTFPKNYEPLKNALISVAALVRDGARNLESHEINILFDNVYYGCMELYQDYEKSNWNVKTFEQIMRENF